MWHFDKCSLLCSLLLSSENPNNGQNNHATSKCSDQTARTRADWSEPLLVARTIFLEVSCRGPSKLEFTIHTNTPGQDYSVTFDSNNNIHVANSIVVLPQAL